MPTIPSLRFAVMVNGMPRTALSVTERSNGDLLLLSKPAAMYREAGKTVDDPGQTDRHLAAIREDRISVHWSENSTTGVNVIKHTLTVENGETITKRHVTKAIKQTRAFAHVFSRRCPDFSLPRYASSPASMRSVEINLGEYDKRAFSLLFSVFVSEKDRAFQYDACDDFNIAQHVFHAFRLVILWAFLSGPSSPSGLNISTVTLPEDECSGVLHHLTLGVADGYIEPACVVVFKAHRNMLRDEMLAVLRRELPEYETMYFRFEHLGYFRKGIRGTAEWDRALRSMIERGIF